MTTNFENKVICCNCEVEFYENEIQYNQYEDKEYCPYCSQSGCLADVQPQNN